MNISQVPPSEPSITSRLAQARESLDLAEMRVSILRGHLFGEGAESSKSNLPSTTVRSMVDDIGSRLASLCGDLATINQRMGCPLEKSNQNVSIASNQFVDHNQRYSSGGVL